MLPSREQYQVPSDPTVQSYNPPEEATALNGPPRPENDHAESNGNVGIPTKEHTSVLPLSRKHLEMFAKISPPPPQYRATVRTDTVSTILDQEFEYDHEEGRRPSIRVDNWDYIYTERVSPEHVAPGRLRCPIHRYGPEPPHRRDSDEPELPLDARKSATLKKHYYLEGGWGWIIVVCSVIVNVLNHGVQLSTSQLTKEGAEKFKVEPVVFAGLLQMDPLTVNNQTSMPDGVSIKYLGVTVDRHLKWDIHIDVLVEKLRCLLLKFKHLKKYLNTEQV
ncbi:uncharacterized protein LOC123677135 [Harmonia axyridis]|uniref:uncharacterized protein LOC123677135 n=1 Tax=Harmonia axyridis TaxID=115357 RepID=UPI001E276F15|nr:uncharacterized protein LOC123677135 [Harmonia axyridis]